jgi:hypothetical protein
MKRALYLNRAFFSAVRTLRSSRQNQFIDFKHDNMRENSVIVVLRSANDRKPAVCCSAIRLAAYDFS